MGASMPAPNLRQGALYMSGSALLFAGMAASIKIASRSLPNTTVVFFRNAAGLLALLPWLVPLGWRGLGTRHLAEHLVRGLGGLASMYCYFYALARLPLADAVLLNYCLPLFLPMVEKAWLGEPVPRGLWRALGLGFAGLLLVLRPGFGLFQPAAVVGLLAAVFAAVAQVGVRRLTQTEPVTRIVFYFGAIATAGSALPLATGSWATPPPPLWGVLLAAGVLATAGQLLLTRAYAQAPAAQVGPFIYTSVVFAGLLDWLLGGRLPDRLFFAGATLVCLAAILALRLKTEAPALPA